jgi:hypothetical protein
VLEGRAERFERQLECRALVREVFLELLASERDESGGRSLFRFDPARLMRRRRAAAGVLEVYAGDRGVGRGDDQLPTDPAREGG